MWWPDSNIGINARTIFSVLLPSVNVCIGLLSSSSSGTLVIVSAVCSLCLTHMYCLYSLIYYCRICKLLELFSFFYIYD
jgi:hypothetical protein